MTQASRGQEGVRGVYHFSVDDVFQALVEASDRNASFFDHDFFRFLRRQHETFGVNVDLYIFYRGVVNGRIRTLEDISSACRCELQQATWLRFGPHALDYETPPYAQTLPEQRHTFDQIYSNIERFAGPASTSRWLRLHFFSETYELAPYLRQRKVEALFLTDKPAVAYRLPAAERKHLADHHQLQYQDLTLLRSHFRLETLAAQNISSDELSRQLDLTITERGYLALFTHEVDLRGREVRHLMTTSLTHLSRRNLESM